jgi:hypothetical protein
MRRFNNRIALRRLLNRAINDFLEIGEGQRNTLTADNTEHALASLDALGDQVRDRIRRALAELHYA